MLKRAIFVHFLHIYLKNHAPHIQYNEYAAFNAEKETMLFQRRSQVGNKTLVLPQTPKPFLRLFKIVRLFSTF